MALYYVKTERMFPVKPIVHAVPADSGAVRGMLYALRGRYDFLNVIPIGRSVLGRDIYGILLGAGAEKALYAAAFHGQEWMTSLILLKLCEDICEALAGDGKIADMDFAGALSGRCLIMVPQVNPDGVDIAIHSASAAGPYAEMVARLGGNRFGVWQANARGVDINHNFDAGREELEKMEREAGITGPAPSQWCGPAPHSEPETQTLVQLCKRGNFRHVIAMHSQGEEIYWQYGDRTPPYAQMMAEIMAVSSGYKVAQPEGLASHGGFKDWFIQETGRPGFTIEFGKGKNPLPLEDFEGIYQKTREMLLLAALM